MNISVVTAPPVRQTNFTGPKRTDAYIYAKESLVTQEQFAHFWDQLKAPLKEKWGKITEADLLEIQGSLENFATVLQRRYGELHKDEVSTWADRRHAYWSGNYIGYKDPQPAS